MPDRHWREGLHQAVEAKEKVQVTMASDHAAQQFHFLFAQRISCPQANNQNPVKTAARGQAIEDS